MNPLIFSERNTIEGVSSIFIAQTRSVIRFGMSWTVMLLVITGCGNGPFVLNDLFKSGIMGKVQSITDYRYSFVSMIEVPSNEQLLNSYTWESKSFILYNPEGNVTNHTEVYDGLIIRNEKSIYGLNNELTNRILIMESLGMSESRIYEYDNMGRLELEKSFNDKGDLQSSTIYKYDEQGNNIETKLVDSDGKILYSTINSYDSENNVVVKVGMGDSSLTTWRYAYNEWQDVVYTHTIDEYAGTEIKSRYIYDENRNKIKEMIYDERTGNLRIIQTEYSYDKKGNWVRSVTRYFEGQVEERVTVVIRDIKYAD